MKTLRYLALSAIVLGTFGSLTASLPGLGALEEAGRKLLPVELEKKKAEQLESLKKEKQELSDTKKEFNDTTTGKLSELKTQAEIVKTGLEKEPDNDFFIKKSSLLNTRQQVLREQEQEREQLVSTIDQHIKILQDYLADPQFENYQKKELKIGERPVYSFADLQLLYEQTVKERKRLDQLSQKERNINAQLENRKKSAAATIEDFKKKQEAYEKYQKSETYTSDTFEMSLQQRGELHELERALFEERKDLDSFRQKTIEHQIAMIKTQVFINRAQLDIVKELLRRVKPAIRVSESEITQAKDALSRRQQQLFKDKELIRTELEELNAKFKKLENKLEALSKKNNVPLGLDLDDWSRESRQTVASYLAFIEVADLNSQLLLVRRQKHLDETRLVLEDEKLRLDDIKVEVQESFYMLSSRKDISEDDVKREIKEYDKPRAEVQENFSLYTERRNSTEIQLEYQKRALENVRKVKERVEQNKDTVFKDSLNEYTHAVGLLISAEETIKQQIETLNKILSNYADILNYLTNIDKQIEFITAELNSIVLWQRPEVAISWSDIQTIMPDLQTFAMGLQNYLVGFDVGVFLGQMRARFATPFDIILALFNLFVVILAFILIRSYLPQTIDALRKGPQDGTSVSTLRLFFSGLCEFTLNYFIPIAIWSVFFLFLQLYPVPDVYYYVIFYLISIPYLLYLAHGLIRFFARYNEQMGYSFVAQDFQSRIVFVISTLLYATIIIFFFREAFILVSSGRSKLPVILLALNFIILQISLILMLSKEQILSIFPEYRPFWEWIREQVNAYYYIIISFVIAMIVMSNPYVGFGFLVRHILFRSIYTGLVIFVLYQIHLAVKRRASYIFFDVDQDVVRERFSQSKTWYGVTVIALFLVFSFVGIVFCAQIWDWPETLAQIKSWSDFMDLLKTEIMFQGTAAPLSTLSILKIILFIIGGTVVSFAINRFVLGKIFNVLLVDAGVQNAVSSIMRYVVIAASIIFGFESVGLHNFVQILLGALLLSVGWIIKDPVSDFIAYFIILVQRPLKVGDYIRVDAETLGVVRKITARSVVLRRRNSTTIVIPNTKVVNQPIVNWNYVRSFIAFNDIMVTVSLKEDPAKVKELLLKVLDESPYVLKSPKPVVRFENFSDFGFTFLVRGFLSSNYTLEQWDIASDVRIEIVRALRAHNIRIAIPVRMVFQKDGSREEAGLTSDMTMMSEGPTEPKG